MVTIRSCGAGKQDGSPCGSPPLVGGDFCYMHDPAHAQEMQEARRVGGLRKRRETTVAVAYEIDGVESVPQLRRVLEIVILDALGMDNTIARGRLLVSAVLAASKLTEIGEIADQFARLHDVLAPRIAREKARRRR